MNTNIFIHMKKNLISLTSLGVYLVFYLFFAFYDGAVICVDSPTYISMSFIREPIYPLILAFFRQFSSDDYLLYVVIFQSLLAAFAGWAFADYIRKRFRIPALYSILLYLVPLATSLLCRFAAARASMYTNSILTEGVVTSLYLLFMLFLSKYLMDDYKKGLWICCILSFIMISTRKQMLITLPLLILAMLFKSVYNKTILQTLIKSVILCITIMLCVNLFDCSYNYVLRGKFEKHSSSNRFLTTMIFYNAERSDADYIQDEAIRELFLDIYDICDEKNYIGQHAGQGWLNEVNHFGNHYDHIQIDTMWPMILEHAKNTLQTEDIASIDLESDRINSTIIASILPHQIPDLLYSLYNNFLSGLVITVAQLNVPLIFYSVFIYAAFLFLALRIFLLYRKHPQPVLLNTLILSVITLLGIIFNVGVVSAVIFCQTRYTIYNMPLFYITGAVLLYINIIFSSLYQKQTSDIKKKQL